MLLIQIGGLGVVTVAATFAMLSGRKISLMQRSTMQDAISAPKVGGIVRLTRFIVRGTFLIELIGMFAMLPVFCRDHGFKGIWMAAFHSVSAFAMQDSTYSAPPKTNIHLLRDTSESRQ